MLILYSMLLDKSKGEIMKTYKAGIDIGSTTVKLVAAQFIRRIEVGDDTAEVVWNV